MKLRARQRCAVLGFQFLNHHLGRRQIFGLSVVLIACAAIMVPNV
jgi:hypothetical protein